MEIPVYRYQQDPTTQLRVPDLPMLPEEFGQAVPRALEQFGAIIQRVAQVEDHFRKAQQRMAAEKELADNHIEAQQLLEDLKRSPNYEGAIEMTQQGLQGLRQRSLKRLTDPEAQQFYEMGFLRLARSAGGQAVNIRAKGRMDDALASRAAGIRNWTDAVSRADTAEEQAYAVNKVFGLIREGVNKGLTTAVEGQKDLVDSLGRAAHAHALRRRLSDPEATAEAVEKGQGIYQFLGPEQRERTVTLLVNQTEKERRGAQAEQERETKRISDATEIGLLRSFDYPEPGVDPSGASEAILKQGYEAFAQGLISREALERVRGKLAPRGRAAEGDPRVYADFMSNAIRGTGKYSPADVAEAQLRGDLTPAEMHGIIGAMERRQQSERDRSQRREQTDQERAQRAEERRAEDDVKMAAKLIQRQISRAAKQRDVVDQNQINLIQDLAEQEVFNLRRERKLTMEQVPAIAEKYIPLLGGLTSSGIRTRLDSRFSTMLDLETTWREKGLKPWEYERERELWMLYDRQVGIDGDAAIQKAYKEAEKAYREQWFFRRWGAERPQKPAPSAPAPLPPRSGGSPLGTAAVP